MEWSLCETVYGREADLHLLALVMPGRYVDTPIGKCDKLCGGAAPSKGCSPCHVTLPSEISGELKGGLRTFPLGKVAF